jgi:hypothetical protein
MSGTIRTDPTDDPAFIELVERIAVRTFKQGDYDEDYVSSVHTQSGFAAAVASGQGTEKRGTRA